MQWLITGCSTGLGLELVRAALTAGQKVIASSRNPSRTPELVAEVERQGGHWITLDVTSSDVETTIQDAIAKFGPIDVLVNSVGYPETGIFESKTIENMMRQFDTNVYGTMRTIKGVLPSMRARKAGVIVNVSSCTWWMAHPGASLYAASKGAMENFSDALGAELADFNIRVLVTEPGAMQTDFGVAGMSGALAAPEGYQGSFVVKALEHLASMVGRKPQDPKKVAAVTVREVLKPTLDEQGKPLGRMPQGKAAIALMQQRLEQFRKEAEIWQKTDTMKVDFDDA